MKFRKGNKIRYGHDHHQYVGIPSGIDFKVKKMRDDLFMLTAENYGQTGKYGNGHLFAWGLTASQRQRFERAAEKC